MKIVALIHRWAGGTIGLLLALLGLSGAVLIHRRSWVLLPHVGDAQRQDTAHLSQVTAKLMTDPATRPSAITFAESDFGLNRLAYQDTVGAYTDQAGHVVARWSSQWERPEIWLFDFHRHLFVGDLGETIVGIAALAGIGFIVTGATLWWRTRKTFALRLWPRRMTRPAIMRQHRDFGIVAAPLLLLSLFSGAMLVFRPLTSVVLGPGAATAVARASAPPAYPAVPVTGRRDWAGMIVAARTRFPEAELRSLALPRGKSGLVTIRMRQPGEWLRGGRTTLWFAADTGRLIGVRDALGEPRQVRGQSLIFPLHAGEAGGIAYRLVMTASGLSLAMLGSFAVWSFWFRRPKAAAIWARLPGPGSR